MRTFLVAIVMVAAAAFGAFTDAASPQSLASPAGQAPAAAELDQLLAPIALYPDQLLGHMLLCSTDPGMVVNLNDWLKTQTAKGSALQDAAVAAGFAPSYVALALFPQVVQTMVTSMSKTQRIGQAFTANRSAVFDSIQRLRHQAQQMGALKDTAQQDIETKTTSSGQQVIVIEPANPQVIYVPQYNSTTVYTQPTTTTQTVIIEKESHSDSDAAVAGVIGFTAGIAIGAAMNNSYYYGPYGWHGGGYMYNDAWDDYMDHREDAREDWQDHREDMNENRSERAEDAREQRGERAENRNTPESQAAREQRRSDAKTTAQQSGVSREQRRTDTAATEGRGATGSKYEARGSSSGDRTTAQRSGTRSDAFSGYSSGGSERAASSRGSSSRSGSRGGGSRSGGSRGGGRR